MNWGTVADVLGAICLVLGASLSLAAGVGVLRFPDVLSRMHAATKPQVLGLLLILLGVALRLRSEPDLATLLLVGLFQLATAPVAAHMVGRTAYRSGRFRRDLLSTDELATAEPATATDGLGAATDERGAGTHDRGEPPDGLDRPDSR